MVKRIANDLVNQASILSSGGRKNLQVGTKKVAQSLVRL